jgi:hypothetical protein
VTCVPGSRTRRLGYAAGTGSGGPGGRVGLALRTVGWIPDIGL